MLTQIFSFLFAGVQLGVSLFTRARVWLSRKRFSVSATSSNTARHTVGPAIEPRDKLPSHHLYDCFFCYILNARFESFCEVALSRVRSLEGLSLDMPLTKEQVTCDRFHSAAELYQRVCRYKIVGLKTLRSHSCTYCTLSVPLNRPLSVWSQTLLTSNISLLLQVKSHGEVVAFYKNLGTKN